MAQIVECVPNIAEGRRKHVIDAIADAVRRVDGVRLLDVDSDADHHRTVLTLAGAPAAVAEGAFRCVFEAAARIDVRKNDGVHPRLGSADVVPFVPLRDATLDDCVALARALAARVRADLGVPAYLYDAASPYGTTLPEIRKQATEAHPTAGATAVGARGPLIAFNVDLETTDLDLARAIAREVRGLPAVRALGFPLAGRGCVQVSMNLLDHRQTSPLGAFRAVAARARERGVAVRSSEVVGMILAQAVEPGLEDEAQCGRLNVLDPDTLGIP